MTISGNRTYFGFLQFIGDNFKLNQIGHACSQNVRMIHRAESDLHRTKEIHIYFPDDWLISRMRNKVSLDYWGKMISQWFASTSYIGETDSSQFDSSLNTILYNNMAYGSFQSDDGKSISGIKDGKLSHEAIITQRGDAIINDKWHHFVIQVDRTKPGFQWWAYASFCLIRYLYCAHYQPIVDTYFFLRRQKRIYKVNIDDFILMEIAHNNCPEYSGFSAAYALYSPGNRDVMVPKLVNLEEVKESFKTCSHINHTFLTKGLSTIKRMDLEKYIEGGNIKYIYEKLV